MTRLGLLCDRILEAGWLAALVTVPLYFNIFSSRVFEPDKLTILRAIVLLMCFAYTVKIVETGRGDAEKDSLADRDLRSRIQDLRSANPLAVPVTVLAVIYILATAVSISPVVSFWGSYQRLQGTYTFLTYVALFFIIANNLRSRAQVDRFVKVALLVSIPISLYGIAQSQRLDPLPWGGDVTTRVASSMGNAIFLAAYLIMVIPLTMARLVDVAGQLRTWNRPRSTAGLWPILALAGLLIGQNVFLTVFVKSSSGSPNLWWGALPAIGVFLVSSLAMVSPTKSSLTLAIEGTGYATLLLLQFGAVFLTQSRGPWIGLGVGIVVFIILYSIRRGSHRMSIASSAVAGILVAFVILLNVPSSPLAPLRSVPYIGRMGQLLETETGTGKVRLLIWQGAWQLVTTHPSVGLTDDPLSFMRPLIGYGPEAMYVAFNKVYPPDLAHYEARNASPDRSHMDVLDHLVMTGILGTVGFFVVLYVGLKMAWRTLNKTEDLGWQAVLTGIIAGIVAHFFETQVGIAIASTLTYLWAFLGLAVAIRFIQNGKSSPVVPVTAAQSANLPVEAGVPSRPSRNRAKARQLERSKTAGPPQKTVLGLLKTFDYSVRPFPILFYVAATTFGLVYLSKVQASIEIRQAYLGGFVWFVLGIALAALSLGGVPKGSLSLLGNWRAYQRWFLLPLGAVAAVAILFTVDAVVADIYYKRGFSFDGQRQWDQAIPAYQEALTLAPNQDFYYLFMGRALVELAKINPNPRMNPPLAINLDQVRRIPMRDIARSGRDDLLELSRVALEEALALSPLNTDHYANLARLYRYWGEIGDRQKLDTAIKYYTQATDLSPQAAHLWAEWAEVYLGKGVPAEAVEKAKVGANLDPVFHLNFVYLGDAYLALGQTQNALDAHVRAIDIDPMALSDARLEGRLGAYLQAGIADKLAAAYGRAAQSERGREAAGVRSVFGYILSRLGRVKEASQEFRAWTQLAPKDWLARRNLALSYEAQGMLDEAIAEGNEAKKLAPQDQQAAIQNWISELQKRRKG